MLVVLTTVAALSEAEGMSEAIVLEKLAACVQILPKVTSIYAWEGKVEKQTEHLLLIKTTKEKWEPLKEFISANHSYEVPEIISVESENVAEPYRRWLVNALG